MGYKYLVRLTREDGRNVLYVDPFTSFMPECRAEIAMAYSSERALEPGEQIMLKTDGELQAWLILFFIHAELGEDNARNLAAEMMRRLWRVRIRHNLGMPLCADREEEERQ